MRIRRHFTTEDRSPYEGIEFRSATSEIRNPDGTVVFRQDDIEGPAAWSQVACDVLAQKYFRKAGIPVQLNSVPEDGIPDFLLRRPVHPRAGEIRLRVRTSATTRLFHPERCRRSRQRRRDHGSVDARSASVQIRLGNRIEFLEPAWRG